jgi:N6-L-threonylcarbamoyladenine synthase
MYVLGIESSCDETACAVVRVDDERRLFVVSDIVASQIALHRRFGGIVPEVAARHHIENILPTIDSALKEAKLSLSDLGAVAVTRGPGLVGALLVAVQVGKTIAFARGLPLCGVNHLEGHLLAAFLRDGRKIEGQPEKTELDAKVPPLPHLGLLVSGGHTALVRVQDFGRYEVLGSTCDDAAGEAFDKVGKILGLGYPAGPTIDRLSEGGDPRAVRFPKSMTGKRRGLAMSFSGLKTAAAEHLHKYGLPKTEQELADFCASFQAAIIEQLTRKTELALIEHRLPAVVLSGGVACNRGLRKAMATLCEAHGIGFYAAPPRWCSDNAAMIAGAGALRILRGERSGLDLNAEASLPL